MDKRKQVAIIMTTNNKSNVLYGRLWFLAVPYERSLEAINLFVFVQ